MTGGGGCTLITRLGTDLRGEPFGKAFYLGGAGTFGHVGTLDVPRGLRDGGYDGAIEVFGWQSLIGGTLRDQVDRRRNEAQARKLAGRILEYRERYRDKPVNIIALSAGTGIAAWALERLPDDCQVTHVVFLSSSLSRQYDLTEALRHVAGSLYVFHSPRDPVLRYGTSVAGSVDRRFGGPNVAGLYGFALPPDADPGTRALYAQHVRNKPWRAAYSRFGYRGRHTDGTRPRFIARIVAPLLQAPVETEAVPAPADNLQQTTQPARPERG